MNLLKRYRFLPGDILKEFYFKAILTSVKYGLVLWGSYCIIIVISLLLVIIEGFSLAHP